jgi:hypothetical protein
MEQIKMCFQEQNRSRLGQFGETRGRIGEFWIRDTKGRRLRFLNVPCHTDYDEVLIGAPIFTRFISIIDPVNMRFGLTPNRPYILQSAME